MTPERRSGILLHPTSLPGPHGSGDLGPAAYHFVDWLVVGGQTLWQVLPLGAVGPGNSPYMSPSAFAGNLLLVDLGALQAAGWLDAGEVEPVAGFADRRVDFDAVHEFRLDRLRRAAKKFFADTRPSGKTAHAEFSGFCFKAADWLDDYALFMALSATHGADWRQWPGPLRRREAAALADAAVKHIGVCAFWKFGQWCFARQGSALRAYAHARGVEIVGDVPIFVADNSVDVWAHPELFDLDAAGNPRVIAGVPPDYFSATGQRWGNPLYRWSAHRKDGYAWWISRLRHALALADIVRIDHFRGFAAYWEIPASEESAINGRWLPGPGKELFNAFKTTFADLPIIAEDLGVITPDVEELRDSFDLPGMRILQFAFAEDATHAYLPHNFIENTVAYTGTHDNNTTIGWWRTATAHERAFAQHYLGTDGRAIQWTMMRSLSASVARLVVYPMQDVLELDADERMNIPGSPDGNWGWRFGWHQVQPWHAKVMREMAATHGRTAFTSVDLPA